MNNSFVNSLYTTSITKNPPSKRKIQLDKIHGLDELEELGTSNGEVTTFCVGCAVGKTLGP